MENSTENTILIKARTLFLKYGVKSVSMDDIAKNLGMSKKTLYQYFDGKKDLIMRITQHYIAEEMEVVNHIQEVASDAVDEMIGIARYVIDFINNLEPSFTYDLRKYYPNSWSLIQNDHMGFVEETIILNIERGKNEGVYRPEIQTHIIAKLYVSNSMNIILMEMPDKDIKPVNLYKEMIHYHLHGLMTNKGKQLFKDNKTRTYAKV